MADLTVIELTMSLDEARSVTTRIRQHLAVAWVEIVKAYDGRAWLVLGYASWDAYCAEEFAGQRIRLPREDRQEVVSSLRESGLSIRAIAAATGADTKTVQSDIAAGVGNSHTSSTANELVDKQAEALVLDDDVVEAELVEERAAPKAIIGTDGKTYRVATKPKPSVPVPEVILEQLMDQPERHRLDLVATANQATKRSRLALLALDPVAVARALDQDDWSDLTAHVEQINKWFSQAKAARPSSLRLVGEN
jgi:transposase-like protein